jgi:putative acetyltransferase
VEITVRHAEPGDYEALHRIFSGPKAVAGTLQLPFPSAETWRRRLAEPPEGLYSLVACVEGEVVGSIGLETSPTRLRMRHVGSIGMAVRDDWQGKGVGTALMGAALDLADNWLNLERIELRVYVDNAAGTSFRSAKASAPDIFIHERHLDLTREQLDPSTFEAARAEGSAMTFDRAVAYALEDDEASPE